MNETNEPKTSNPEGGQPPPLPRRQFLEWMSHALGAGCALAVAAPLAGFVMDPVFRKIPGVWRTVGKVANFKVGETVSVAFEDSSPLPWAGVTAKSAAWLRRESEQEFTAFSLNCTHLGCPVRWLPTARLFMCPCHGGVYYQNGNVAAGPPPHPLPRYPARILGDEVQILASPVPITTT